MQNKQIRVSSVIVLRWLNNNSTEVFKNLSQLYKKYDQEQLGVSRRVLYNKDLFEEHTTSAVGIKKSAIQ
jgi:hypothetical protein